MNYVKTIMLVVLLTFTTSLHAQREITDRGTVSYVVPDNVTISQAEMFAVESAKLKIIADNFGTVLERYDNTSIMNKEGISSVESLTFAGAEVRGEWIATIGEPKITRKVINNKFVIDVTIMGRIREIISAPIEFRAKVLRNGVTDNCESDRFKVNDMMYMSFQAPEDGYVSVYMTDGKTVQCLFPYNGLPSEYMKVRSDERYVFFSKENSGEIDPFRVSECMLGCNGDNEHDRLYVIFSPHKYSKAVDHADAREDLPRILSNEEFHTWLSRLRRLDKELTYKVFDIVINN